MDFFLRLSYNLCEDEIMEIQEIKKALEQYKNRVEDLWRSL